MEFSVEIIELVKYLKSIKKSIISNQIGRSGTSIGANINEAIYVPKAITQNKKCPLLTPYCPRCTLFPRK
ncbi:MAG: four helix bundle protein [Clostridia bacterium]|nr:four helix bundle protein [Clostridia bacterium]